MTVYPSFISFTFAMAPSAKKIQDALLDGTYDVFKASPGDTTVNKVRKHAEQELGLEDGFLSRPKWKAKSKMLIKERVVRIFFFFYSPSTIHPTHFAL